MCFWSLTQLLFLECQVGVQAKCSQKHSACLNALLCAAHQLLGRRDLCIDASNWYAAYDSPMVWLRSYKLFIVFALMTLVRDNKTRWWLKNAAPSPAVICSSIWVLLLTVSLKIIYNSSGFECLLKCLLNFNNHDRWTLARSLFRNLFMLR